MSHPQRRRHHFASAIVLLLVIPAVLDLESRGRAEAARPVSLLGEQGYSKIFAVLGMGCECCDGVGGQCRSSWEGNCPKLKCLPWKSHSHY